MRNEQNRFGREVGGSAIFREAPLVIKIGFNKAGEADKNKRAGKLPGFLICHNSKKVGSSLYAPAYAEMELLGYTREMIDQAMKQELKAEPGELLPLGLRVAIPHDAVRVGEGDKARWIYPGTLVQEFQLWGKTGLACEGDGVKATRRKSDFTTETIKCAPVGTDLDKNCCPFSVDKSCKSKSRWIFTPFYLDKDGVERPLSRTLGWNATAKLDTTSDYAQLSGFEELDRAADQLNGRIGGLAGTLFFGVHEKRYDGGKSVGRVGQIRLQLDEPQIERRASGESERIASAVSVAVPEQVSKPAPQPEREASPSPQSAPAPTNSQEPADEEREVSDSTPPEPVDLDSLKDADIVDMLREFVDFEASRLGGDVAEVRDRLIQFNFRGTTFTLDKLPGEWAWFMSAEAEEKQRERSSRLREIARRVCCEASFGEFQREGVSS